MIRNANPDLPPPTVKITNISESMAVETDKWRLQIKRNQWGLALINQKTGSQWRLESISWMPASGGPVTARLETVKSIQVHGNSCRINAGIQNASETVAIDIIFVSSGIVRLSLPVPPWGSQSKVKLNFSGDGPFFGLGERFTQAKLDGARTTLRPEDLLGRSDHNWTYIPSPFLFTPRGLGLYLDTGSISSWDFTAAAQKQFSVEIDQPSVDCYFFVNEPKGVISDYTLLTGRTPAVPPWTFGIWICSYQSPAQVLADARKLRENRIPSSAIWLFDAMGQGDIMGWPLWWTGYYPEPRKLTDQLHDLGFKVLTYVHPYLRSVLDPYVLPNPKYEQATRNNFFVLNAAGKPSGPAFEPFVDGDIDFTNPQAAAWWESKIKTIVVDDNFDGWMEDFGEWVNDTDRFAAGKSGRKLTNLYPLLYHRITYEVAHKLKNDVVEFDRSGYAGSQDSTPVVWGGDQFPDWSSANGLPSVVPAGITAGLSGFAVWGPDIASNGHSKELWIRWTEFGALTPVMRDHLWDKPPGAVNLWYDAETIATFRRYAQLHISLFPYFYSYAREATDNGLPIIRHLMLQYPDDTKAYDAEQEYLLGENILVAPVVEQSASTRSLYLPNGAWINYWTGDIIEGGRQVSVPAPLEQIPMLIKAGAIVPMISPETGTLAWEAVPGNHKKAADDLIWRVFPAADSSDSKFKLYDGTLAMAHQDREHFMMRVEKSPITRHQEVVLTMQGAPRQVLLANAPLPKLDETDRRTQADGWWLDTTDKTIHVIFSKDNFELKIAK
ncbi:MAG: glycoside hydrolase family 31 protein [Terriglobales bacterium]